MRGFTYPQLKQARDIIISAFGLLEDDATKIIAHNNINDPENITAILAGNLSSVAAVARVLGITLDDNTETRSAEKTDKKKSSKTSISPEKKSRSHKKDSSKAKSKKTNKNPVQDIPTINGDIVTNTDIDGLPAGLPDMIAAALDAFTSKYNMDLTKARQQQWGAACSYVGQTVFKANKKLLADTPPARGGFRYDFNKLYAMVGIWSDYCSLYSKVPLIADYCLFVGVDKSSIYGSGGNYTQEDQVTPARVRLLKKLHDLQESGLASAIVDGRQNPTGALAALNHWHGWTQTREVIHNINGSAPAPAALPVFDGSSGLLEDKNPDKSS